MEDGQWKVCWINESLSCICVLELTDGNLSPTVNSPWSSIYVYSSRASVPISAATVGPHHISPTRFSVKVMMCIISSFLSFKQKKMILADFFSLGSKPLFVTWCLQNKTYTLQYDVQDFSNSGLTLYCLLHFPQCSCHWASKSSTNAPSSCNIQSFLSLTASPTSAPTVSVIFSESTWVLIPLQASPASPREASCSLQWFYHVLFLSLNDMDQLLLFIYLYFSSIRLQ